MYEEIQIVSKGRKAGAFYLAVKRCSPFKSEYNTSYLCNKVNLLSRKWFALYSKSFYVF